MKLLINLVSLVVYFKVAVLPIANADEMTTIDAIVQYKAQSAKQIPIKLIEFKSTQSEKHKVYIQSGLHGNEKGAVAFTRWMANRIKSNTGFWKELRQHISIDIVPVANPQGYANSSRYNGSGVNLNRNFNVLFGMTKENPGKSSFSEYETNLVKKLFAKKEYDVAIDIHGYVNWLIGPSNPYILGNFSELPKKHLLDYKKLMSVINESSSMLSNYHVKTAGGLGDGGAFEDWAFWSQGVPAFCLEIERNINIEAFQKYEKFLQNSILKLKNIKNKNVNVASASS